MEEIRKTLGTQFCRRCDYCAPCTVGINIPSVFLMQGYYNRCGLQDWAKARYGAAPPQARRFFTAGGTRGRGYA
ncbi:MAG: hypothetical protein ACI3XT_01325 [Butyricicoccaceae bacterium]